MSVQKNTPNFLKHSGLSFTTIVNQTMDLIKDDGALGIYCYLASKPQNWEICQVHLGNRFGKGRDYIRNKIKILKTAGLIKISSIRDEKGKVVRWETSLVNFVDSQNTENPHCGDDIHITENPTSGKTHIVDNQALVIKDKIKIKDKNKNKRESGKKRLSTLSLSISSSFLPDESNELLAAQLGLDIKKESDSFVDWNKADGSKSADWNAKFNMWLRRSAEYEKKQIKKSEKFDPIKYTYDSLRKGNPDAIDLLF